MGPEGEWSYHGSREVSGAGGGSRIEVHLHTERLSARGREVPEGLRTTLAQIKQTVENPTDA